MTDQNTGMHCAQSESTLALSNTDTNYRQYLYSVFGESTAEYFLNPSSLLMNTPAWYTQMKDNMKDNVSAGALWDALRQRSARILEKMEVKSSQVEKLSTEWDGLKRQDHLLRLSAIRLMFHSAQRNQAYTAALLHRSPLPLLSDPDMTEGPSQYLPEESTDRILKDLTQQH
ncbi:hypothetical protein NFI96_033445 [Prochilodus magdalenae]|nr:hypothetical protein NFI96_033445 [Prochilodus magdalenae]